MLEVSARGSSERVDFRITFLVLAVAGISYSLLQSMVAPALPALKRDLNTSESGAAWVLTAFLLSASVATPLIGRVGDIYGKKRTLVAVLVALSIGTLMSAVATTLPLMIAGRVVQGAAGGIFPLAFGIIRDEFPRERVASALGLISASLGVGAGVGVVLAGVVVERLDYHWIFWLPLIPIVGSAVASALLIPESPVKAAARIPWQPAVLLSAGLATVLIAISQTSTWGWGSTRTIGLLVAGLVLLAIWVLVETRIREPLVDMRVMARRGVWTTNLTGFTLGIGMYGSFIVIPLLVELPKSTGFGFGASITGAGLFLLPMTVMLLVASLGAGRIERRVGSKPALVAGAICALLSYVLFALAHSHVSEILIGGALLGTAVGLSFAAMANLIVNAVPQDQVGVATGVNTIVRTVGGALGAQICASIIAADQIASTHLPAEQGFVISFWILAGALGVSVLAALAVPGRAAARTEHLHSAGPAVENA
jgi:MFS family permease